MEEVRCSVDCWAEFGDLISGRVLHCGSEVLLTTGSRDLLVLDCQDKRVKAILQLDSPVTVLALSDDKSRLYALCQNQGLYCMTYPVESRSDILPVQKSDDSIPTISRESIDVVIEDGKVQSFILVKNILITVSHQESFWSFDLYEVPDFSAGATIYRKYAGFQVPAVGTTVPQRTVDARIASAPVLTCIYPRKDSLLKEQGGQRHSLLEPLLFRLLFGVDAFLVNSPVILCGLPDGRVLSFPPLLPACGEEKPRIKMLHSLEQPVTFIGTSVTGEQGPRCLVVLGQMGRILLIKANEVRSDGKAAEYSFIEQTVRAPVVCACVDGEHVYYSTSMNLVAVPLSKTVLSSSTSSSSSSSSSSSLTAAEGERQSTRPPLSQSAISLNVCRVIALAEPTVTPAGRVQLLALSLSGKLLHVTVPQKSGEDTVTLRSSSQVGQTVKDLLAGIGNVWERASSLKLQLQLKNNILKRLNQVINICNLVLTHQEKDQEGSECRPPISCHVVANWSTLLQKDALVLTCTLENFSACILDQGWTLFIEVQLPYSLSAESTSRTYSVAFKKLDCGQKMNVSLPLESQGEVFLPVQIHCFLVYSLQSLLYLEESKHLSASDIPGPQLLTDKKCISLALNTLTLDWLDCLRAGKPDVHGEIDKQNTAWEATHYFLSSRQFYTDDQPVPKASPHVVLVRISFELLRTGLGFHDCSSAPLCISVLKWLLSATSEAEGQKPLESTVVCAYGPDRQPVRLLAKEVILSDVSSEGPISVVEIQLESFSMTAVCGLHHAVLRRVQALLKNASVRCVSPKQLKGQGLLEAVRHAESLYKNLQDSRTSAGFGEVKARNSEAPFHLYLQLRENPLVIL